MSKHLNCILLVDDSAADNEFHQIIIGRMKIAGQIAVAWDGIEALEYLKDETKPVPELIFLDINMPKMNGWEFLEEYKQLNRPNKQIIIVMLTTSANPEDIRKAQEIAEVNGFETKPLTPEMMNGILKNFF